MRTRRMHRDTERSQSIPMYTERSCVWHHGLEGNEPAACRSVVLVAGEEGDCAISRNRDE
jgi:hypothetical protein